MKIARKLILFIAVALSLSFLSCGGSGGGGDDYVGSATLSLDVTPRSLGPGDRFLVQVRIDDVHEDGIMLKVRYAEKLSYVTGTSYIEYETSENNVRPDLEVADEDSSSTYLVFFLTQNQLVEEGGTLVFELLANESLEEGVIAVDADVNTSAFNVQEALFSSQDEVSISIREEN